MNNTESNFFRACQNGNIVTVNELIDDIDVSLQDNHGTSSLMVAAHKGHIAVVEALINHGAVVNMKNNSDITALSLVANTRYFNIAKLLVEKGANVNHQDWIGDTALINASYKNSHDIVSMLIENGADVNLVNNKGRNALIYALYYGHQELAELLIKKGSELNIQDNSGLTPLSLAITDENLTTLLINRGVNLDVQDENGFTVLMTVVENAKHNDVRMLVKKGANVHLKNDEGKTALDIAIAKNDFISMVALKSDLISQFDDNGFTLLMKACQDKDEKVVLFLHEQGADFHQKNKKGQSAYSILNKKKLMPDGLKALKEKLKLEKMGDVNERAELSL